MRNRIYMAGIITFFCTVLSCADTNKQAPWSIRMADAVIQRYDSLAYYNGRTAPGWSYDVALLGTAIDKLGGVDSAYSNYMKTFIDRMVDENGHIERYDLEAYNLDLIRPANNLLELYVRTGEEKYQKALGQFITQMENHPKTHSGGFWHKRRYPWQMWLDGIYMASPFLTRYAHEFNQPQWLDVVAHQVIHIYEKTRDPQTGLLYHAWDESREQRWSHPETGQSPHFWSRAMGWYLMALVDILDYFPKNHPQREEIIHILHQTCEALLKVQDQTNGVWYQVLDMAGREGNYPEASGSAMFVYAFAKGAKNGYLPQRYWHIADEAFDDFVETFVITDEDGLPSIVHICGSCGLGGKPYRDGSYQYYINERIVKNDSKGVAPFILAALELNK
jgi:unsaturated rhamnogalacturonyl hydrolase